MAININGSGTITGVSVGGLPDGIVDTDMLATDAVSAAKLQSGAIASGDLPAGSILQVQTTLYETATSFSVGDTYTDHPFYVAITPSATTSKIIVSCSVFGEWGSVGAQYNSIHSLNRFVSSTNNYLHGAAVGNRHAGIVMNYITYPSGFGTTPYGIHIVNYVDTPGVTSEVRYYPASQVTGSTTFYINRTVSDSDAASSERGVSWITAMEVAA